VSALVALAAACSSKEESQSAAFESSEDEVVKISPTGRAGSRLVWDNARSRGVLFGGINSSSPQYKNETWLLDVSTGVPSWTSLSAVSSVPTPRYATAAVWASAIDRIIVHGGRTSSSGYANDVWVGEIVGTTVSWTSPSITGTGPSTRYEHTAVWDAENNRAIVFGGIDNLGARKSDLWTLTFTSPTAAYWTSFGNAHPDIGGSYQHTAVWDAANRRMYVYGGSYSTGLTLDDVWYATLSADTAV